MRMQDHGHRGVQPTGYRTRDIEVTKGANVVRVPEPIYDEGTVIAPCAFCFEAGAMSVIGMTDRDIAKAAADLTARPGGFDVLAAALHERKLTLAAWRTAHEQHQLDERWVSDCEACMYELMEGTRTL